MKTDFLSLIRVGVLAVILVRCSGTGDLAGGSGSGNPGGTVMVAIIADTTQSPATLSKTSAELPLRQNVGPVQGYGPGSLPLSDADSMGFRADSISITAQRILFVLEEGENALELVREFTGTHVSVDSGHIAVDGPFRFDLIRGTCVPPLDSLRIPEARYRGIRFMMKNEEGLGEPIIVKGYFQYLDSVRPFVLRLPAGTSHLNHTQNQVVSVHRDSLTLFELKLATSQWLQSVDLKGCIQNGSVPLTNGGIVIGRGMQREGNCVGADATIRENLMRSGSLVIGNRP